MARRKSIFITGGGSGIGRAVAQRFAQGGWFVGLGDVDDAGMAGTVGMIGADNGFTQRFDVRERAAWDKALAAFDTAAGGIDALVNNAGIPLGGPLIENSEDEIARCLDVNLKGVLFGAQAAFPYLLKTAPGSCLLNTASAAGIYGSPSSSVYSATKFGVRGLTESLDGEWAKHGIKVASLCPSFIDTPLLSHTMNARANADIRSRVVDAGLEITPVSEVAEAAWNAVHGDKVHWLVGKTAKRMGFGARWMPGRVRKDMRKRGSL
ncbi:MAG: SDR family oxidoreductase [Parerythrobacter sp.]